MRVQFMLASFCLLSACAAPGALAPEAEMRFRALHPTPRTYDFAQADAVCELAKARGSSVRGRGLVSGDSNLPTWIREAAPSLDDWELAELLKNHIQTTMRHFRMKYPGVITSWVVVDEAFTADGAPVPTIWDRVGATKTDYIDLAVAWAHEADPNATLFHNDKHIETGNARVIADITP